LGVDLDTTAHETSQTVANHIAQCMTHTSGMQCPIRYLPEQFVYIATASSHGYVNMPHTQRMEERYS